VLGLDEGQEPSLQQQADALKETLNVICGNLLPLVSDRKQVFNVHAPQILEGDGRPAKAEPDALVLLYTDAGSAEVWLSLDAAA
jgi:CheY-specific phosphatase CheX